MRKFETRRLLRLINVTQYAARKMCSAKNEKVSLKTKTRNIIVALFLSSMAINFSVSAKSPTLTEGTYQTRPTQKEFKVTNKEIGINIGINIKPKRANFKEESASHDAQYIADWIIDSNDNEIMPFVIVDKKQAKVFVFDAQGQLSGAAPALLGLAVGDTSIPDIGNMALADIKPEQRTTPAGRFVASLGKNLHDKEVLWVDYDGAISLHRVVSSSPKERRLQRLASQNPLERRISYGCINVPVKFYDKVVSPAFNNTNGVVYVLPDTLLAQDLFGSYNVQDRVAEQIDTNPIESNIEVKKDITASQR